MSYQPVLFGKGQKHCKDNKMKKNAVQTKMYPTNSRNEWAYQIPSPLLQQVGNKTFTRPSIGVWGDNLHLSTSHDEPSMFNQILA